MGLSGVLLLSFLETYFLQATEDSLVAQARITAQALIPEALIAGPIVEQQAPLTNAIQQQQVSNLSLQTENLTVPPADDAAERLDLNYLADASLQLGAQLETRIRLLDAHGTVLVDSSADDAGRDLSSDRLVVQALEHGYATRSDQAGDEPAMHVILPAVVDDRLVGMIYLSQPLRDVILVLRDVRTRLFISTAVALSLSAVAGLILSGAITRPLQRLTKAAGSVAQGDFDQQVEITSRDEVGRLGKAFNEMTARLRAARQMQIDFVANVSHELRTPLTSIKGMAETLRDGAVDDIEVRDHFLETIETETDRLTRLVNDLLLLSQADSDALNLRRSQVDIVALVRAVIDRLAPQAQSQGLTLRLTLNGAIPTVWIDPDRVEQILVNLLDNAFKYSRSGGEVAIKVAAQDEHFVQIQVCDEGVGIPPEDLSRIGERFYRVDASRSRAEGGSGLGLAIVRTLVQAHGGALQLESEQGVGTTVSFTLPVS